MEVVQPIRDINKIKQIESNLKKENIRDYILFELGIYSGLRISDILKLKVKDVKGQTHFTLREQKTGKSKKMKIHQSLKVELNKYIKGKSDDEYLFRSQKGDNNPIQRMQAWRIINSAANRVGIVGEIGTHTLRKTFGYHFYNQTKDIVMLQNIFNHVNPNVTLAYIGMKQDDMDTMIDNFKY